MIDKWKTFCAKRNASRKVYERGVEVLSQTDPMGKLHNVKYYQKHGLQELLEAIDAEDVDGNRERERNRRSNIQTRLRRTTE